MYYYHKLDYFPTHILKCFIPVPTQFAKHLVINNVVRNLFISLRLDYTGCPYKSLLINS